MIEPLDILAIAAHRDDIEQTCGGTLLKMATLGRRTGVLDLTQGELGSRGSADDRAREAEEAARILKLSWREALDIPDGRVENTWENRLKIARIVRLTRPRVVILPYWEGRHPDHYTCGVLGYEACFLAGLSKLDVDPQRMKDQVVAGNIHDHQHDVHLMAAKSQTESILRPDGVEVPVSVMEVPDPGAFDPLQRAHRPFKIVYATLYHHVRPTFVVDITDFFEERLNSLLAYKTQFADQEAGKSDFPPSSEIRDRITSMAMHYGMMAGVKYAEPFLQKEVGLVDDLTLIPVKSI